MFGEVFCTGHHQGGPLLQLPQSLASLIQSDASPSQLAHYSAGRYLHALHATLARDVLGQTSGGLPCRRLTNCGSIKQLKRREGRAQSRAVTLQAWSLLQIMWCTVFNNNSLALICTLYKYVWTLYLKVCLKTLKHFVRLIDVFFFFRTLVSLLFSINQC